MPSTHPTTVLPFPSTCKRWCRTSQDGGSGVKDDGPAVKAVLCTSGGSVCNPTLVSEMWSPPCSRTPAVALGSQHSLSSCTHVSSSAKHLKKKHGEAGVISSHGLRKDPSFMVGRHMGEAGGSWSLSGDFLGSLESTLNSGNTATDTPRGVARLLADNTNPPLLQPLTSCHSGP